MENLIEIVKESGAKLTSPRKKVLEKLYHSELPLTLKEIHNECKDIDFASVYRTIKLFNEIGLVDEITFADKKIRYELVSNLHNHHIICSNCGEIEKVPICFVSEIKKITKYKITKHTLEFMGLCPNCQN
ncbi:MAG: transcriptional repressor [Ignavibacteriales bacterium]|nr:transcriptional repressor [Ignavibacteriales bacterium]